MECSILTLFLFTISTTVTRGHFLKLFKPFCKHSYAQNFCSYCVILLLNNLPQDTVSSCNLNAFKSKSFSSDVSGHCRGRAF